MHSRSLRHTFSSLQRSRRGSTFRTLRSESLEPRTMLSGSGFSALEGAAALVAAGKAPGVSATPVLTSINLRSANGQLVASGSTFNLSGTGQTFSALGIDQSGITLAGTVSYTWSITTLTSGSTAATLTPMGNTTVIKFNSAGSYKLSVTVTAGSVSLSANVTFVVAQVVSSIKFPSAGPYTINTASWQPVVATCLDQFGNALATPPTIAWSTVYGPSGAAAPVFTTTSGLTTVRFAAVGSYMLQAKGVAVTSISFVLQVTVNPTLTSIALTPSTASVGQGTDQAFAAQALDQFGKALTVQPAFTWSATNGTVNSSGVFSASGSLGSATVTARSGTVAGSATITVVAASGWKNAALGRLIQSLDADGSLSRNDMIQILQSTGPDGTVDANEFADLQAMLKKSAALGIPGYVQVLAGDVVNGNVANAKYQGQALGNLAAGSSAAQLNKLVGKWFLGADHPAVCNTSYTYKAVAGALFYGTPSHADEHQGQMGDCYFISAMGTLADSNQAAVRNMFIDNGDGTYTVRFYFGPCGVINNSTDGSISAGFSTGVGTVDYITVDRYLPVSPTGMLTFGNGGTSYTATTNSLWISLAEKAYAQWNETGREGRDGLNAYASTQGGWMATVQAQVLGYNALDYIMTRTSKQVAINALNARKAVTIGTLSWNGVNMGLYANHAYAIIGYSASTDTFTLYNPWGSNQPGQLTWSQLQTACSQLCVADTSGTTPFLTTPAPKSAGLPVSSGALSAAMVDALFAGDKYRS